MSLAAVARVVPGTLRTTTGTQDFTSRGVGTPTGVMVLVSWATVLSDSTFRAGGGASQGYYDGTRSRCMWYGANDGASTQISGSGGSRSLVAKLLNPNTGATALEVSVSALITDGVRLNVSTTDGSAFQVFVILFGGTGVSCYAFDEEATGGGSTVTCGFQPDFVLTNRMKRTNGTTEGEGRFDPGIATRLNPIEGVCCIRIASDTSVTTAEGRRGKYSTFLTQQLGLNEGIGGSDVYSGETVIDDYASTGFDVQGYLGGSPNAGPRICGLAVKWPLGVALDVDEVSPVSTGGQSKTFPSFRAGFVYAATSACTSDEALQNGAGGGCGAGDFIQQRALVLHDQNNVTTTNAGSRMSEAIIDAHNGAADTHLLAADLLAPLSTGFSLNWTVVDASNPRHYAAIALEVSLYEATFDVALPALSGSFDSDVEFRASFAETLPALQGVAVVELQFRAAFAAAFGAVEGSTTARLLFRADFAPALPAVTGAFAVRLEFQAAFAVELPALTGVFVAPLQFRGTFAELFGALEGATSARLVFRASFDNDLAALQGMFGSMTGQLMFEATFAPTLPALTGALYAYLFGASAQLCLDGAYAVLELTGSGDRIELAGSYVPRIELAGSATPPPELAPAAPIELAGSYVPRFELAGSGGVLELEGSYTPRHELAGDFTLRHELQGAYDLRHELAGAGAPIELAGSYDLRTELQGERETC